MERRGLPDGTPSDRSGFMSEAFGMNPGSAGVHVSFPRQEINERNGERKGRSGSGVFKIRGLFLVEWFHRGGREEH